MPKILTLENHLNKPQLRRKYLSCQHAQEKIRWQALYLIAEGGRANQVAQKLGRSSGWMSETVRRYNEGGVEAVKNKTKNQVSKTLTAEQIKELEGLIESGKTRAQRLWSSTQIKQWVKEKTGREIHKTTAWRMARQVELYAASAAPSSSTASRRSRTN